MLSAKHVQNADEEVVGIAQLFVADPRKETPRQELLRPDTLDFSVDSLEHVNAYLDAVRDDPRVDEVWNRICLRAGAYVGEVIRENGLREQWHWLNYENARKIDPASFDQFGHCVSTAFVLHQGGQSFCFPLGKIHKYLENGSEDNLRSFAQVILDRWMETQHEYA